MIRLVSVLMICFFAVASFATAEYLYYYKADIVSVYDGDTVRADIDLGLDTWIKNVPLRLYGINAPEITGKTRAAGVASRDYLMSILSEQEIVIKTFKDKKGKYGRILANILVLGKGDWCELNKWCDVNEQLVIAGYAEHAEY